MRHRAILAAAALLAAAGAPALAASAPPDAPAGPQHRVAQHQVVQHRVAQHRVAQHRAGTSPLVFSGGAALPPDPSTGLARNQDGEPGIAADGGGTFWIGSDVAPYGKSDPRATSGVFTGEDIWSSTDGGRSYRWVADPFGSTTENHGGLAGEDSDIAAAPARNAAGFYNVYAVSLWLGSTSLAVSSDGGNTWTVDPLSGVPAEDRPWVAADGACTVYVTYHQLPTFSPVVNRYDLCDLADSGAGVALNPASSAQITFAGTAPGLSNAFGKTAVDTSAASPYRHSVYVPMANCDLSSPQDFVANAASSSGCPGRTEITVAVSRDGGRTFGDHEVALSDNGELPVWPDMVATDAAGTVYLAWSDNHDVYLSVSHDGGVTWDAPLRVNQAPSLAGVYPTVTAGAAGQVTVAWYGADRAGNSNNAKVMGLPGAKGAAVWRVFVARSTDGGGQFVQVAATGPVHTGELCTQGDGCTVRNSRNLLDDFGVATSPTTGLVSVAYTSDQPSGQQNTAFTGFTTQLPTGSPQ